MPAGEQQEAAVNAVRNDLMSAIARRWGVILLCALAVPALALVLSLSQPKEYEASASLLFRDPAFDQKLFGSSYLAPSDDPDREAATNLELVSLDAVAARTARALGPGNTQREISAKIDVSSRGRSNVVSVAALDRDPAQAARVANIFAAQFIGFRQEADREKLRQAQALVQKQLEQLAPTQQAGPQGDSLRQRAQELEVLASLQTGNAEVVQRAAPPPTASSPKPLRNTILGLMVGLLLGTGLAFLLERLDKRFRTVKEVGETLDLPVLATVPQSRHLGPGRLSSGPYEAEAFRMLRANLRYFNVGRSIRSVLITSAAAGDGKSTVAWNLASATGGAARTLLIEADLRRPVLAERLEVPPPMGLSNVLVGAASLDEAVRTYPVVDSKGGSAGAAPIDVLVAGPSPPNPHELLDSEVMRELVEECERRYDMVVIDTPPTSVVSDAIPLMNLVSGVIVVVHLGRSRRDSVRDLRDQLHNLSAPTLGVVINSSARPGGRYGYEYYGTGGLETPVTNGSSGVSEPLADEAPARGS